MAYQTIKKEHCTLIINSDGPVLGMVNTPIIEVDGQAFKDLAGAKELLPYEDWRLDARTRAKDLAARLSIEQIAGLMLFSTHQVVPFIAGQDNLDSKLHASYNGVTFEESEKEAWELTDEQKRFIIQENMRHILLLKVYDVDTAARWANELQQLAEAMPFGIPVCIGSDPRHAPVAEGEEYKPCADGLVSAWPQGIGLAATFDPSVAMHFGEVAANEYRALGITMALSPQVDLATDPRWMRYGDTFGGHCKLVIDMSKAYCDGMQTTKGMENGWGKDSVATMAKHWPGGGSGEGGRDAHYPFGKYNVYPGDNFENHLQPFTEGVFELDGPTKKTAAVMPDYSVSWKQDKKKNEEVGNAYSEYIMKDLLRKKYDYEGIVCTDWGITKDPERSADSFGSRCYGVEGLSEAERHLKIIMNGVDQFGGEDSAEPILQAYEYGCAKYGESNMRKRMEESAVRLLEGLFRLGLFENPYVDPVESVKIVANREYKRAGYEAQLESVVLLKNRDKCLPFQEKIKVYIPDRKEKEKKNFFRVKEGERTIHPVMDELVKEYFELVDIPEKADAAILFLESPESNPYSVEDRRNGGNGYLPISLQYRPYTANFARKVSIAGGDFRDGGFSRSYHGKTVSTSNVQDLYNVLAMRKRMGRKPIIACIHMKNPTVLHEIEPYVDGIIAEFGVERRVLLDMLSGRAEPNGLLPMVLPKNMDTVERHFEDVSFDIEPYTDSEGATYTFGFGMNWSGRIYDERMEKYRIEKSRLYNLT